MGSSWFEVKMVCVWFGKDGRAAMPEGYRSIGAVMLDPEGAVGMLIGAPVAWLQKVGVGDALSMMCDAAKRELRNMVNSGSLRAAEIGR